MNVFAKMCSKTTLTLFQLAAGLAWRSFPPPAMWTRRSVCLGLALASNPLLVGADEGASVGVFSETFYSSKLGLDLEEDDGGRIRIARVERSSEAFQRGVPPLTFLTSVNGKSVTGVPVQEVQQLIRSAQRPLSLEFDRGEAYAGLSPEAIVEKAARANGFETSRVNIVKFNFKSESCGYITREGDVVEVEYTAALPNGAVFDSTSSRGRPFAAMLGNGDMVKGLELGLLEMCIGEERQIEVPSSLGFGSRGSRTFGVPPDATLVYRATLKSINGFADPAMRRDDDPAEQRF